MLTLASRDRDRVPMTSNLDSGKTKALFMYLLFGVIIPALQQRAAGAQHVTIKC